MKPVLLAAVTVGLVTCAPDATAGDYMAMGVDTNSCGSWTAARRTPTQIPALLDETWVQGFLSGVGAEGAQHGDNPLNGTDGEAVQAWIDNYCGAHPLDDISVAAVAFFFAHQH